MLEVAVRLLTGRRSGLPYCEFGGGGNRRPPEVCRHRHGLSEAQAGQRRPCFLRTHYEVAPRQCVCRGPTTKDQEAETNSTMGYSHLQVAIHVWSCHGFTPRHHPAAPVRRKTKESMPRTTSTVSKHTFTRVTCEMSKTVT
ncbi:hypothetical protein NDU88_000770 [Pleurodeles waltl]|uniref:Uncharacterized protein n=1 Tax=Pleurodeles waltl TaxID=8319 RepID=A0AAV7S858_PLEWA|nr:hypothetical protein NDU88_000770 [Pleurodeles waltl]